MIRHRNLTKGGYASGANSYEYSYINSSTYGSQSYKETSNSNNNNNNSGNKRQEAIQIWPQEVNLKLRISKLLNLE